LEELGKREDVVSILNPINNKSDSGSGNYRLNLITTMQFQQRIDQFTWSPQTFYSNIKPTINFAVCNSTQHLLEYTHTLNGNQNSEDNSKNTEIRREKLDVDSIFDIAYDLQNGDTLAIVADNYCFLWDSVNGKLRAKFQLQSPGVNICWHKDEKSKLMVGEKSGLIRIYHVETLKPLFTLMSNGFNSNSHHNPLLSFDWSDTSPEVVVANTLNTIVLWNTFNSCLPDKVIDNFVKLKMIKMANFKENLIGFIDGRDASSKLTVMNFKTNQVIYQSQSLKLLESYSFNAALPIIAIANEHQLNITKVINY
jgi:hypothetical protein